ncbi:hypothetical protein FSP39_022961 [Pinctada imbricata]|uniref:receptor protein-tyrosine kinase n=1 Tax=Pinctada imbricata TaxID=66713 RepID=A0AA88YPL9_PINIB|nr:hypothetical protein FSP39_022961 [Pinctada imbricata]
MDVIGVTVFILTSTLVISPSVTGFYQTYTVSPENLPLREITTNNDGDIYIGGQNILLHLSKDLNHIANVTMGPVKDSKMCEPKDYACSSRELSDNLIDVLIWVQQHEKLLVCGTINQGLCELREDMNISLVDEGCFSSSSRKKQYSLIGADTDALVHPYEVNNSLNFFVTSHWDGRNQKYYTDEFFLMDIRDRRSCWSFSKVTAYSSKAFSTDVRQNTSMNFLHSFDSEVHGSYLYNIYTRNGKTRIVRICKHDKYMDSLTEFTLKCGGYNIASAAFFDSSENNLFMGFGIGSNESSHKPTNEMKANVCKVPLSMLHNKFQMVTNTCYSKGDGYSPPRWATNGTNKKCKQRFNVGLVRFCGTDTNKGIDSDFVHNMDPIFQWSDGIITTIFHHKNEATLGKENILNLGTSKGHILKVDLSNGQRSHYAKYDMSKNESVRVEPKFVFDQPRENVYLITGNKVSKFPIYSCRVHTRCDSCVTSGDPLGCGWCKNICVQKGECSDNTTWHEHSCPPFIYKIDPVSGPREGNTTLTIQGEHFGSRMDKTTVSLNNISCSITNVTDKKIVCMTSAANTTDTLPVNVKVAWQRKSTLNISGTSEIFLFNFSYKVPNVTSVTPIKIPKGGNVLITIEGEHLDIGGYRQVRIVGHTCNIISTNSSKITCKTNPWYKIRDGIRSTSSCIASKEVEVQIDGSTMYSDEKICLTDNPAVDDISPMKSIMSGGVLVTIRGTNLDSVSTIRFVVKLQNSTTTIDQECKIVSRSIVQCMMPNISSKNNIKDKKILRGSLSILMNNEEKFWTRSAAYRDKEFFVYPDPVFSTFGAKQKFEIDYTEKLLELKGQNLNHVFGKDNMSVTIEGIRCPIERMDKTFLFCNLHTVLQNISFVSDKCVVRVKAGNFKQTLGHLSFHPMFKAANTKHVVTIASVTSVILFFVVLFLVCMYINHVGPFRRKARRFEPQVSYHSDNGRGSPVPEALSNLLQQRIENEHTSTNEYMRAPYDDKEGAVGYEDDSSQVASTIDLLRKQNLLIDSDNLRLGSTIGRGNFGCVYEGYWIKKSERGEIEEQLVAVKTILRAGNSDVQSFLDEALIMKDFNHPNVMSLIGISLPEGEFPVVVLPFMKNGDLLSYIRNDQNEPTVRDLVNYGLDIAKGMEYLASIKFIHRDLAARNCMMDSDFTVKVADFGLSRDIYSKEYYKCDNKKKLPVKWMAPESIEKGTYTVKSDVWSFGVVLWELMTRGASPYGEVDNWDMTRYIRDGRRLPRPEFCPLPLYKLMLQCWEYQVTERPTFTQLIEEIENLVLTKNKAYVVSDARVDLQKCTNYHYTDQRTLQPQLSVQSTVSESAALLPQTE